MRGSIYQFIVFLITLAAAVVHPSVKGYLGFRRATCGQVLRGVICVMVVCAGPIPSALSAYFLSSIICKILCRCLNLSLITLVTTLWSWCLYLSIEKGLLGHFKAILLYLLLNSA